MPHQLPKRESKEMVTYYEDSNGVARFAGGKDLKSSQSYPRQFLGSLCWEKYPGYTCYTGSHDFKSSRILYQNIYKHVIWTGVPNNGDSNLLFLSLGVCLKNTGVRRIRFYMVFNGEWSTVQHLLKLSSEGKLVILISHKVSLIRCNILQPTRAQPGHGVHGCSWGLAVLWLVCAPSTKRKSREMRKEWSNIIWSRPSPP